MASRGSLPSFRISSICSVMGISTPCLRARPRAARVVSTPSATWPPSEARISGSLRPWPSCFPDGPVAAERTGAGEHQIAHAGEAGEGFAARAAGHGEARDLGNAAGDEGGGGVVTEAHAGGDPGGDGDDVFERAAELDPDDIGGRVEAERFRGELLLDERGDLRIAEGHGKGSGLALGDFESEAGPGERADREQEPGWLEGVGENLRHAVEGVVFKAFGGADDELAVAQVSSGCERKWREGTQKG